MSLSLIITAIVTMLAAVAAMSLRNLVHCALMLAIAFSGVAVLFLKLDAEFAGFTEILVYVGAVAILVVMAILLTRSGDTPNQTVLTSGWFVGALVTVAVFALLAWAILQTTALPPVAATVPSASVKQIGLELMSHYVLPLEVIGLVLTVAMIGAVVIASKEEAPAGSGPAKNALADKPHAATPITPTAAAEISQPAGASLKKEGVA
jgi:NADH-quinone oxidoreductase subunit J